MAKPLLLLTAVCFISLPVAAHAEHCDEQHWQNLVSQQHSLDAWYNQHAEAFNRFLTVYKEHKFLHIEFTDHELSSFWLPGKPQLHKKMQRQIELSDSVFKEIRIEIDRLSQRFPNIEQLQAQWVSISRHCNQAALNVNAISASEYVAFNESLKQDIQLLIDKLWLLQNKYYNEVTALTTAKFDQSQPQ
ncbi:hypothetical protein [Vibrio sonorensis]|uniref:hypothetical protein n=1 Tax=Vibrio sonorensis TaxID=1004316 RepID=UPI0008D973F9|nr:hypothetical protein [Vibrio sonorensis]